MNIVKNNPCYVTFQPLRILKSMNGVYKSIYPKVNYFPKIEDHDEFECLKLILSFKTTINRISFSEPSPPPPKREVAFSVVVYSDNYHLSSPSGFSLHGGNAVKFNCF